MRRSVALLTASLLLLAGCGDDSDDSDEGTILGDEEWEPPEFCGDNPFPDIEGPDASEMLPELPEPAGDDPVLDAVTVAGDLGEEPTVDIAEPVSTGATVRRVVTEGDGEPYDGGLMVGHFVILNGRTGEEIQPSSYDSMPTVFSPEQQMLPPPLVAGVLGVPVGSRVLVAFPGEEMFPGADLEENPELLPDGIETGDSLVFVVELLHTEARGSEVEPEPGLPTVTLDEEGAPAITDIPDSDPPTEVVSQVLIEGEGPEVSEGQAVLAQHVAACWEDGNQFQSSWVDSPSMLAGPQVQHTDIGPDGVGAFIPAPGLLGKAVGSRVLVIVPPELAYGEEGIADVPPSSTLVFVIDILSAGEMENPFVPEPES